MVNIYASRRGIYEKCAWLQRDEAKSRDPEWASKPTGVFYATEEAPESGSDSRFADTFVAGESSITLRTTDDVGEMAPEDVVRYDFRDWLVTSVQRRKVKSRSEFCRNAQCVSYISLRGL